MDPEVGAKIFLREEVEQVDDGRCAYLRVIPNRKRAMPILVPIPENLIRAREELIHRKAQVSRQNNAMADLERKLRQHEKGLADSIALCEGREAQIANQKAQLIERNRSVTLLQEQIARQEALIEEKDRVIADQVASIQSQHEAIVELGNAVAKNREAARSLALRMTMLRESVLGLLRADEDAGPWKVVHRELRARLAMAGYRLREEMPWWSPVRWFGGGNALPLAFFLPAEELTNGDASVRKGVAKALLQEFRILLSEALGKSSLSVEETGLFLNVEQDAA